VPVLASFILAGREASGESALVHRLTDWYRPLLAKALASRKGVVSVAVGLLALRGPCRASGPCS
jgi:Cu/Ag efflux pump CusA